MASAEFFENLFSWSRPAVSDIVFALPKSFIYVGAGGDIEQPLILGRVLYDGLCLAVDRQHYGPLGLLDLLEKLARITPERRQRLNIFCDVDSGQAAPLPAST
jgi:hypothetical protein